MKSTWRVWSVVAGALLVIGAVGMGLIGLGHNPDPSIISCLMIDGMRICLPPS